MSGDGSSTVLDVQAVACVKCGARLPFRKSDTPRIDECGFESYSLECNKCGVGLAGIIDPYDETLLLSVAAA